MQAEPQRAADFDVKQINDGLTSATQLARQLEN